MVEITSISEYEKFFEIEAIPNEQGNGLVELTDMKLWDSQGLSVQVNIFINDSPEDSSSIEELGAKLSELVSELGEDDEIKISIVGNKNEDAILRIYFPEYFFNQVSNQSKELIGFWNSVYRDYSQLAIWNGDRLEVANLESNSELDTQSVYNNTEFSRNLHYTPEESMFLRNKFSKNVQAEAHFTNLTLIFCLSLIASHIDYVDNDKFIFEGYGRSEVIVSGEEDHDRLLSSVWVIYAAYEWVFADKNISTKLGILRNILSLNAEQSVGKKFSQDFLKVLFSNYQIYLKDNINKYIEVKNKAVEIINNLNENLVENYYGFKKASRASMIGVYSYFFAVIVIRFLSAKKAAVELIDFEIFWLTVVFSLAAIVYIVKQHREINEYRSFCDKRLDSINEQYKGVLSDEERKEVFSGTLLMDCEKEDSHNNEYKWYIALLIALNVVLFFLAFFNLVTEV